MPLPTLTPSVTIRWRQAGTIALLALASCGNSLPEAGSQASMQAASSAQPRSKGTAMTQPQPCQPDAMHRSLCMIRMILEDVEKTHGNESNGGISNLHAESSTSYSVRIPREERSTTWTYEFEVAADGALSIKSKTESTKHY